LLQPNPFYTMRVLFFLSYFLYCLSISAQDKYDYSWILGTDDGVLVNFSSNSLVAQKIKKRGDPYFCTVISDPNTGELLFYANSCTIQSAKHETMTGGDSLIFPSEPFERHCVGDRAYGPPTLQSVQALPWPDRPGIYTVVYTHPRRDDLWTAVWYAVVDMRFGPGRVIEKRKVLMEGVNISDEITAVKHGNGRDWWIVIPQNSTHAYYSFLLSPSGFSKPLYQVFDDVKLDLFFEQSVFSPDGSQFARVLQGGKGVFVMLAKFDRCAGRFCCHYYVESNAKLNRAGGVSFSPNSRYMYFSDWGNLYQYDTYQTPAINSLTQKITRIATWEPRQNPFPTTFSRHLLAPDGKIYICTSNGTYNMHIVQEPDKAGTVCRFEQHALTIPNATLMMPSFPNFRLYQLKNSPCDTLNIQTPPGGLTSRWTPADGLNILPNPAIDQAYVTIGSRLTGILRIYNAAGQLCYEKSTTYGPVGIDIDVSTWPSGIYFVVFYSDNKVVLKNRMMVMR
jgi:Secretion system C-terminal sorting domain